VAKRRLQQVFEFYAAAKFRAQRRRSAWNLILIPLSLAGWLGTWYGLFRVVWAFHVLFYPQHVFRDFWPDGISFPSFVPSFLMIFALAPGALCFGLVVANCIAWLLFPARRTFDAESVGHPGTSFRESTGALLRLALWTIPTGLIIALLAASLLKSLR
jgi:hypothetical protein